jgi:hypothetical protein
VDLLERLDQAVRGTTELAERCDLAAIDQGPEPLQLDLQLGDRQLLT